MTADELRAKLQHAEDELKAAEDTRARIAGALVDTDPAEAAWERGEGIAVPGWFRERMTVELHAADLRVDLYRQVVAELRNRLGLR